MAAVSICASATGAELGYELRAGANYSDNVQRVSDGLEDSTTAAVIGVGLKGKRDTGRFQYDIDADIDHYEYLGSHLDSENFGGASLAGRYDFVPESLGWNAKVVLNQVREDVLRPLAPGNVDEQFMWSTGPTVRMRFGDSTRGVLNGRYTRLNYSNRPFDSETLDGRLELQRQPSPASLLGAGASFSDVNYQSSGSASDFDYQRREAFLRLNHKGARTSVDAEVGAAKVTGQLVDDTNPLARVRLSRRMTPMLTGYLSYSREYPTSDVSSLASALPGAEPDDSSILTAAPRLAETSEVGIDLNRPRTRAQLSYRRNREESLVAGIGSRTVNTLLGSAARDLTPKTTGTLYAEYSNESYSASSRHFDETAFGARLRVALGTSLGINMQVEHRSRDAALASYKYKEFSAGIFLSYEGGFGRRASQD